ncbi:MAG: hypothetical protein NTV01_04990 [Bacteroidia bacterium]|nr:hypothetical protein [Bacteroidia bacterium]
MKQNNSYSECSRRAFLGKMAIGSVTVFLAAASPLGKIFALPSSGRDQDFPYQYRSVSVKHIKEIQEWFASLRKEKKLGGNSNFQSYIAFNFDPDKILKNARSVIIMARKYRMASVTFRNQGREFVIIIPSGYWDDGFSVDQAKGILKKDVFSGRDVALEWSKLPLKTMAVRSGLAEYGLNNISFVKEFGSYHELLGFYTDQDMEDNWGPFKTMLFCKGCYICKKGCPTKCIRDEEFVIDIDHCLTLYNELPDAFPDWLPENVHHTLVGCLKCQWDCPANTGYNQIDNLATLTEEETALILNQSKDDKIQKQIQEKLKRFPTVGDFNYFSRNTRLALKNLIKS